MKIILNLLIALCVFTAQAQNEWISTSGAQESFAIVDQESAALISYDPSEAEVVHTVARLFQEDIERVTGKKPDLQPGSYEADNIIVIGTIGSNAFIDRLIDEGKLDVSDIRDNWERYQLKTIENPTEAIDKALVIVGNDSRGTAYGALHLSEKIGVSPWYWWADVPVDQKENLFLDLPDYTSKVPSVKYRGIFINDEDWGLKPWASDIMDPEIDDIGPNTYTKVCELILRLKGNMLAPAMHEVTGAFYKYEENKVVANKYGIMITTSHAEPLLYNNTTEWDHDSNGDWDYVKNKKGVLKVMDDRVKEASPYENVYTMGMRGIHDRAMSEVPEGYTKARVLEEVIDSEREILKKYIDKPIAEVPQIFVPYKEVLDIYNSGMNLPEDITIVWPDDNYGYIKKLNNPQEAERKGGAGVYYHISYLGFPNDYLWLNTTPPALMYEEMHKAYKNGAQKYWLLNVGDIKPGELGTQFFLDLAWDIDSIDYENLPDYNANFLASIFGKEYFEQFKRIYNTYFHLGFERKPEYMGWDWRWNSMFAKEDIRDTEFSFENYNEAQDRLDRYSEIANEAKELYNQMDEQLKPAFFELVYYPVVGAYLENHKMLLAQKNRSYALQNRASTNKLAERVVQIDDSISTITQMYNSLENNKWEGIMTAPERVPEKQLPPLKRISEDKTGLGVFVPESNPNINILPEFNRYTKKEHHFEIYNQGTTAQEWDVSSSKPYINLSKTEGNTEFEETISVSIDWEAIPKSKVYREKIIVNSEHLNDTIHVVINNKEVATENALYTDDNGVVSILTSNYSRIEGEESAIQIIPELGYDGKSIQLGQADNRGGLEATVAYDFYTPHSGYVTVYSYALPTFAIDEQTKSQYGIQIDDSKVYWESTDSQEYTFEWQENVIRNTVINTSKILIDEPGVHSLKLIGRNPGVIIQKLMIDTGGLKPSYLGAPATVIKNK